jgi:quinol monooxygenase YgiN
MIIVAGTIRVPPENMDSLRPHARRVIEATRAEPGCQVYSFAEDLVDPGLVRIFEIWESREHLEAHGKAAHMAPWRDAVQAHGVTGRDIRVYAAEGGEPI